MAWTAEDVERRLFAEDPPEPASAAVVLGAVDPAVLLARADRAAELWASGLVPVVVASGGLAHRSWRTEADAMADRLRARGVPDDAVVLEAASRTTHENARFSAALLVDRRVLGPGVALLVVSSPWHLGRAVRTMAAYVPRGTRLLAVPSRERCSAGAWRDDPDCARRVEEEARIFEAFVLAGIVDLGARA